MLASAALEVRRGRGGAKACVAWIATELLCRDWDLACRRLTLALATPITQLDILFDNTHAAAI